MTRRLLPAHGFLALLIIGVLGLAAGCNIAGPAAYFITGTGTVPAQYELLDRPTVVFVDDRGNVIPLSSRNMRVVIADRVTEELLKRELLTTMIAPRDAIGAAAANDRHSDLLSVGEIGRLAGVEQVIYIEMVSFGGASGEIPVPTAIARVRVIDVPNRVRLFPTGEDEAAARIVQAQLEPFDTQQVRSTSNRLKLYTALAEETGVAVARLFYAHEPRAPGKNLNPR